MMGMARVECSAHTNRLMKNAVPWRWVVVAVVVVVVVVVLVLEVVVVFWLVGS